MKPTNEFDPRFSKAEKQYAAVVCYADLIEDHHQALLDEWVLDAAYLALLDEYEATL